MRFALPTPDASRFFCEVRCETVEALRDPAAFAAAYAALPAFRRDRADAYRRPEDRLRSVAAFDLLRRALAEHGVSRLDDGAFVFNGRGKPSLAPGASGEGRGGGLEFNLSHSGDWVLVAVSNRPVGADIQRDDGRPLDGLARAALSPAEEEAFAALPPEARAEYFYTRWTAKESYLKLLGCGLDRDLKTLALEGASIDGVPIHSFRPAEGVYAAVACATAPQER